MLENNITQGRRKAGEDCFKAIVSCLNAFYRGDTHMYKPLASQLRLLLCDAKENGSHDKSLLLKLDPNVRLMALKPIQWHSVSGSPAQMAEMAFKLVGNTAKIFYAELIYDSPPHFLPLSEWRQQVVTLVASGELRVWDIIRCVADKDGGAHFDDEETPKLSDMRRIGINEVTANIFLPVAVGRYALGLGKQLLGGE